MAVLPKIIVHWDAEAQQVKLEFNQGEFKGPDMIAAVLGMALKFVERQGDFLFNMHQQQQMAIAQQQAQQNAHILRQLRGH